MSVNSLKSILNLLTVFLLIGLGGCLPIGNDPEYEEFSGQRAYQDVINQVEFGARHPETVGHDQILVYMEEELERWRNYTRKRVAELI